MFLAARLLLSSRGLVGTEGGAAAVLEQLAGHGLAEHDPDVRECVGQPITLDAMRDWPCGLEAFYQETMNKSGFVPLDLSSPVADSGPGSLGMRMIGAVLVAASPLTLLCLGELCGVSWQRVRNELRPVCELFPLEHSQREAYLRFAGLDLQPHEHVLGNKQDRQISLSCALSTVTVYHKSVFDW